MASDPLLRSLVIPPLDEDQASSSSSTSTITSSTLNKNQRSTIDVVQFLASPFYFLYRRFFALHRSNIFTSPSTLERFIRDPIPFFGCLIFRLFNRLHPRYPGRTLESAGDHPIRVVCISDTHCLVPENIPSGDLLIHAGDLTTKGTYEQLREQFAWISALPHTHKVVISGNHDNWLDPSRRRQMSLSFPPDSTLSESSSHSLQWDSVSTTTSTTVTALSALSSPSTPHHRFSPSNTWGRSSPSRSSSQPSPPIKLPGVHYLQHKTTALSFPDRGDRVLIIHGAPQVPMTGPLTDAFEYVRGSDAWTNSLPSRYPVDILVTHTPPLGYLDLANPPMGCSWLGKELWRVKPKIHVFGHIHEGAGKQIVWWDQLQVQWEALVNRTTQRKLHGHGFLRAGWLDVNGWIGLLMLISNGLTGLLWSWVWGGEGEATVFVNAALMDPNNERLSNNITVIDI